MNRLFGAKKAEPKPEPPKKEEEKPQAEPKEEKPKPSLSDQQSRVFYFLFSYKIELESFPKQLPD